MNKARKELNIFNKLLINKLSQTYVQYYLDLYKTFCKVPS